MESSLKKLARSRGSPSTLHRSERVAEPLLGFSVQVFPAAPNGSYGNRRAAGPGPGDCSSPDPQAPMRVTCSGHRGSVPLVQNLRRACVAVPFLTRCVMKCGVLKALGRSLEAHTNQSIRETWGWSPLCRDRTLRRSQPSGSAGPIVRILGTMEGCEQVRKMLDF